MREGRFFPSTGLDRIVEYHERQDARFAEAAAELSTRPASRSSSPPSWPSPIPTTPVRRRCGRTGRLCYPSGNRASPPSATCTATPAPRRAETAREPRVAGGPPVGRPRAVAPAPGAGPVRAVAVGRGRDGGRGRRRCPRRAVAGAAAAGALLDTPLLSFRRSPGCSPATSASTAFAAAVDDVRRHARPDVVRRGPARRRRVGATRRPAGDPGEQPEAARRRRRARGARSRPRVHDRGRAAPERQGGRGRRPLPRRRRRPAADERRVPGRATTSTR